MESRDSRRLVYKQINLDWFQLRCLQTMKNNPFYRASFRNRPIVSIDGYDGTVHRGPFQTYRSRLIVMDGLDATVRNAFIKRLESRPLDLDLTVEMHPARLNLGRYNPFNSKRVFDLLRWTTGPRERRASIHRPFDPALLVALRHLHNTEGVWISPTRS